MAALAKSAASLRILGGDLDPAQISAALGKTPDVGHTKDDVIRTPSGGERIARIGSWSVKVNRAQRANLDAQIQEILAGTTDDLAIWVDITGRYATDMFCGLFLNGTNEGLSISPATMQTLGERGIELSLDIYAGPEE